MEDKVGIIKTYLFALCDSKPKQVDKENLLKVWLVEFDYLNKDEWLFNFTKACRQVINDSTITKIPSPQDIRDIITRNIKGYDEPKEKRPKRNPEHKRLYYKAREILKEKDRTLDKGKQKELMDEYWEVVKKMCVISNTPFRRK